MELLLQSWIGPRHENTMISVTNRYPLDHASSTSHYVSSDLLRNWETSGRREFEATMAIKPRPRSVTFFWGPNRFPKASAVAPLSQHSDGEEVTACFPPGVGRSTEREMGSAVGQGECPISQSSPIFARSSLTQSTQSSSIADVRCHQSASHQLLR